MRLRCLRKGKLWRPCRETVSTPVVVLENGGGAIALVHVEVDDGGAGGEAFAPQPERGHGEVVEDAEAGALRAKGVMGAAGQVAAEAAGGGVARRRRGCRPTEASVRRTSAGDQGNPMRRMARAVERAFEEGAHVGWVVRERDGFGGGGGRGLETAMLHRPPAARG